MMVHVGIQFMVALEPMAGNYNPYAELDDNNCLFPPWQYSSTDCNMTILIPEEINISIDEEPISYGDWIGAFYQNLNGDVICGGAVMWKKKQHLLHFGALREISLTVFWRIKISFGKLFQIMRKEY